MNPDRIWITPETKDYRTNNHHKNIKYIGYIRSDIAAEGTHNLKLEKGLHEITHRKLTTLRQALAKSEADTARVDFLEAMPTTLDYFSNGEIELEVGAKKYIEPTIREAIDKAMQNKD